MAYTLKFKRYTSGAILATTGADGEIFVDTTNKTLVVQDGTTVGGSALATQSSLSFYLTLVNFSNTLTSFTLNANLTSTLANYTTNVNLTSTLLSYTLNDNLTSTLINYVARPEFSSTLVSYTLNSNLTSTLANYITNSNLTSTLASYTTNTNLTSTLASYTTNTNLTSTLTNYTQNASLTSTLSGYTTNVNLTSTLSSYTTKGPAFSVYPSSSVTQTITSGSQQKILFQNEEFDTNNNFASSRFTPTVAGYYQLNAVARISGTLGTGESMLVIWKNGAEYKRGSNASGTELGANFFAMQVSALVYANGTGDFFEVYIQQTSGGSRDITVAHSPGFGNITWFNGSMVRGA